MPKKVSYLAEYGKNDADRRKHTNKLYIDDLGMLMCEDYSIN